MREFVLNINKKDSFMFIDRESGAFLSLDTPRCFIDDDKVSEIIKRAVKNETLVEITKEVVKPGLNLESEGGQENRKKEKASADAKAKESKEKADALAKQQRELEEKAKADKEKKEKAKKEKAKKDKEQASESKAE